MEWVELLRGKVVGLDTAPLIYYVEKHTNYIEMLHPFFQLVDRGECSVVTSTITLVEVLVVPIRKNHTNRIQEYRELLFNVEGLETIDMNPYIAEKAASLRANYNIRTPDSIQVATAIYRKAEFFLTNDVSLPNIPHIKMLTLDKLRKSS